jgi:hypothetical protein
MFFLKKLADNSNPYSYANKFRRKRFRIFTELLKRFKPPVKILDIGGTSDYWQQMNFIPNDTYRITLYNNAAELNFSKGFTYLKGDANKLSDIPDKSYDIVHSNSLIEHLGSFDIQMKFAKEVKRIGKAYYIQTPNFYFPFEPHFLVPFFQFFPESLKIFLLTKFNLGWYKQQSTDEAKQTIKSINLLKKKELIRIFPESRIFSEKIFFLTKSFIAYSG